MKKQTIVDQIEITRDGTLQVRFAKQVVDDDGSLLANEWHRTAFPPGQDIPAQMTAVNANLASMNCAQVDTSETARIETVAASVWTDEVKAAYQAAMEAQADS